MSKPIDDAKLSKQNVTIEHEEAGSILSPLKALQFFMRKPVTVPLEPRPAADNYRGFHLNDHEKCIGCSSCQKVCDNAAITMVKVPHLPEDPVNGVRNLRPAIDYGRCCWCALCVDICPTSAISLSREYVHTCTQEEIDSYFILPDETGIHGEYYGEGWQKTSDSDLLDLNRQPMAELEAEERIDNFNEIVAGYTDQQAVIEASRCVQCGMCHDACPTHMDAPEYIRSIWQGNLEEAVRWIYQSNPFSHVCGRVCTHRCEDACSIGRRGEPVSIRWLKRYAMDSLDHERIKQIAAEGKADYLSGKQIAIIGAGPAGLTTAYDLVRKGHQVTVFEARKEAGGMPRYGIPEYRLPYDMLDQDIDVITSMGVKIQTGIQVGKDITMAQLEADYDAVVLAIGLHLGRSTRVPGADHKQVRKAIDLLRRTTDDEAYEIPQKAVVIGGGNVAMDIARTLARQQQQQFGQVQVTVTALEEMANFLADPVEIKECREEGIEIYDARGPQACIIKNNKLVGLKTWKVRSIFDEQGRFAPEYDEQDEQIHAADMVIEAIGQMSDNNLLGDDLTEALEWQRGRLSIDAQGRTSVDWLWAAGDCVNGPDVVHAIADGHRVAASIDAWLNQQ
ncbi:MAG: FAD-dependent oxidoreductase [Candidatus Thiodiazotropha taylori]|nr:FAD-dependent oxidoreductase [Candidatus Thiodiazotropha taylori]MCG7973865.1 FAD-dependent oxidoreductase [Candidatus Thiodiazotropha taylori]MCG8068073.1 FAD-dependent oxidoreductase [Candidatus Thiodiazotropha taylori]